MRKFEVLFTKLRENETATWKPPFKIHLEATFFMNTKITGFSKSALNCRKNTIIFVPVYRSNYLFQFRPQLKS